MLLLKADFQLVLQILPSFAKGGTVGDDNAKDVAKAFVSFFASLAEEGIKPTTVG